MEVAFVCLLFFGGAVIFYMYSELQSVDQNMWNQNNALKEKINQLEGEIIQLNREIKSLKESDEDNGKES